MYKSVKKVAITTTLLLTGMKLFNVYTEQTLTPVTPSGNDKIFLWKDMKINYTEKGTPDHPALLLLHNLDPASSKEEWHRIDDTLSEHFHIYELDLPGCGKSDKPNIIYINYMYVQIISDFIKNIIEKKTNICAAAYSGCYTIMTARFYPELINKIIVISPPAIDTLVKPATKKTKLFEKAIQLPIAGTFLYNCIMSKENILDHYTCAYFYNEHNISEQTIDISYFNAHYNQSNGKYLLASIHNNYTNINIIHALPKINHDIYFIANSNKKHVCTEYKKYDSSIHTIYVSNCRMLPHMEIPETVTEKILHIFSL